MMNLVRLAVGVVAVAAAGCLDLSPDGKVFACVDVGCAVDAGGTGGGMGGTGGSGGEFTGCLCQLPEARCDGATRVSAAASRCLADGGCDFALIETACPNGCANGACTGEPCLGMACNQPPKARCESATALRVFTSPGACQAGGCLYASAEVSCDCANDRCTSNPCLGVTCAQPPAATCVGTSVRTWHTPGTCDGANGHCAYVSLDTPCGPGGCSNGQCVNDVCAGVVCNQPPAASCLSAATVKVAVTPGTCSPTSGACSYPTQTTTCAAGTECTNGACVAISAGCNSTNCAGCCNGNTCVAVASQGNAQCGAGGTACGSCGGSAPVCESGTCVSKCAGVTCGTPPANTCLDATTVTQYGAGSCHPATGLCSYASTTLACGAGNACAGGLCSCTPESDATLCARLAKNCGAVSSLDNCGTQRTIASCGSCTLPQTCTASVCACVPETNAGFCSRLGKSCGAVSGTDNCGAARTASCGTCPGAETCLATNVCSGCTPETNGSFCGRLGKNCGTVSGTDNCNAARTAACGSCSAPETCGAANVCACVAETGPAFCARVGKNCGQVTGLNNCGSQVSVACGSCTLPETCGANNVCACVPESTATFCGRLGKNCGTVTAADNCGVSRSAACGSCTLPQTCGANNVCACVPETNAAFCSRLGRNCGTVSGTDNCGFARSTACGSCTAPETCGGAGTPNVCGGGNRLSFTNGWQVIPNTGTPVVEVMCAGTVTTTAAGGTKCAATSGDPVKFRINGVVYSYYPGCDGNRPSMCMTSITPSGATYAAWGLTVGAKLLCDAMLWPYSKGLGDNNPGTVDRPVAVVQTNPAVIGTDSGLKNYATFVTCEP